jgi:hypothetical protein
MSSETPETTTPPTSKSQTKKSNTLVIILVVVLVLLGLCGILVPKVAGVAIKRYLSMKGLDVDTKSGDVTLKTDDGTLTFDGDKGTGSIKTDEGEIKYGEDLSLPADFPSNIPVFPGAKIVTVSSKMEENTVFLSFTSDKPIVTILAYYKEEMPGKGWTYTSELAGSMLTYTNEKQDIGLVASQGENGLVSVVISASAKN